MKLSLVITERKINRLNRANNKVEDIKESLVYLIKDKKKLVLVVLVFFVIPILNYIWRLIDPELEAPYYGYMNVLVWTLLESLTMVFTAAAWYLATPKKDFAVRLISLGSVYYWIFVLIQKIPLVRYTSIVEEIFIFAITAVVFTVFLNYIRDNYINKQINYKEEYDGMVYEYHHLCRGFTKTVEGLNHLKRSGYISEEEYNHRLSSTTERFDEFAMKIHERYQGLG